MKTPTGNQARRVLLELQRQRFFRGHFTTPKPWAVIDDDELVIGYGDTPTQRVKTWDAAQDLIHELERKP